VFNSIYELETASATPKSGFANECSVLQMSLQMSLAMVCVDSAATDWDGSVAEA
jgi:hypothetical protein